MGLKWKAVDFDNNTIVINHSVISVSINGERTIDTRNALKNKSSFRTLSLLDNVKKHLEKEKNRRYGENQTKGDEYICVDKHDLPIKPDYVTGIFPEFLKKTGLRPVRFHDLRHNCANLLISSRIPLI